MVNISETEINEQFQPTMFLFSISYFIDYLDGYFRKNHRYDKIVVRKGHRKSKYDISIYTGFLKKKFKKVKWLVNQ